MIYDTQTEVIVCACIIIRVNLCSRKCYMQICKRVEYVALVFLLCALINLQNIGETKLVSIFLCL